NATGRDNAMHDAMKPYSLFPLLRDVIMRQIPLRQIIMIAAFALAALSAAPSVVLAQGVAVLVNGDPITEYDIEHRTQPMVLGNPIIRGSFGSSFQFSDKDIQTRLNAKNPEGTATTTAAYDYTLRPILFVVPRGSPSEAYAARAKEAEVLRTQFQSCEEGVVLA